MLTIHFLSIHKIGTKVLVLEKSSDGWWKGQYQNQTGWFPSNYTLPDSHQQPTTSMPTNAPPPAAAAMVMSAGEHMYSAAENVLDVVVALYRYKSYNFILYCLLSINKLCFTVLLIKTMRN